MTWEVIHSILAPFSISDCRIQSFLRGDTLLLLSEDSPDRAGVIYVAEGAQICSSFHHALMISLGPCAVQPDNFLELNCSNLSKVFNTLACAKASLDALNSTLASCESDQEVIDLASIHLSLPMFYLDDSYRILAITKSLSFQGDAEWVHMSQKGFLSPESARRMKESGDLDLLAPGLEPMVYSSKIYPFSSIICNLRLNGVFTGRLNVLCINGDTSPLIMRSCEIVADHLKRLLRRNGKIALGSPLQSMLVDLLHGIQLSDDLISDRLSKAPYLAGKLMQICYVDMEAKDDRQIASYYASSLERLFPDAPLIPLVFREQLILLLYAEDEVGFNSLLVTLSHFFASHRLRCGVSNHFRSLSHLKGYYDQAVAALELSSADGLNFYHTFMLEHMLSYISSEQSQFLISPDIHRLEEAERDYSFSLVETLRVYLACNCNLIRAAERLFVHKNTLLYRMNHIKSIIQCDLNDSDDRLLLMLSFKLLERLQG